MQVLVERLFSVLLGVPLELLGPMVILFLAFCGAANLPGTVLKRQHHGSTLGCVTRRQKSEPRHREDSARGGQLGTPPVPHLQRSWNAPEYTESIKSAPFYRKQLDTNLSVNRGTVSHFSPPCHTAAPHPSRLSPTPTGDLSSRSHFSSAFHVQRERERAMYFSFSF